MTQDEARMVFDIAQAAARASTESLRIKIGAMPERLRAPTLMIALQFMASKAAVLCKHLPGGQAIADQFGPQFRKEDDASFRDTMRDFL